jgi:hypothetical protein
MSDLNQILESAKEGTDTGSEGITDEQSIPQSDEGGQVEAEGGQESGAGDKEVEAQTGADRPPEPPQKETIPLRTYLQERERAAAASRRSDELAREIDELKARLEEIQESGAPDYDDDPKGYVDRKLQKIASQQEQKAQPEPQDSEATILNQQIMSDAQQVMAKHPDFADALDHVRSQLYHQHLLSGVPEAEITKTILNAETNLAKALFAQGRSPSEFVYNYAAEHGYKPKGQKPQVTQEKSKIDDLERGQKAASPMPSGDGVSPSGSSSRSHLNALDQAMSEAFGFMRK